MRTVADTQGDTWICLELPDARDASADAPVSIECNSGAERVVITAPRGWDDNWTDAELQAAISAATAVPES
jgi:hypothetical protein